MSDAAATAAIETAPNRTLQPVPLLDLAREFAAIRGDVMAAVEATLATQRFILGPAVDEFELAAASALGVAHALGCSSGTDALWLALAALEIGPGDAVLTTPFTFFSSASAVLRAGARPVFADIDPLTFNLSADAAREAVQHLESRSGAAKLRCLQPVHLYGQCADMDAFATLAAEYGLRIVEDAAQAFGAAWRTAAGRERRAGSLGDLAAFSFYPTKNLSAMGDAGMVTTDDAALAERVHMLRAHGMRRRYFHDELGWNCRLDSIQAAILSVKLRRVEAGNARRREIAALYDRYFRGAGLAAPAGTWDVADGVVLPTTDPRATHVFHQYVLRVPRREELREHLNSLQVGSEIFYPLPLHLQLSLRELGYEQGAFPYAERAAREVLALPIYPDLRDDEVETVVEAIRRFYR